MLQQLDTMDCGPTCLRMVAAHYGRQVPRDTVRELCSIGKDGVSLLGISQAAERLGLRSLAVKLPFEKLRQEVPLPCVAHWEQNHFVVIHKVGRNRIYVADPGKGHIVYSDDEFVRGWTARRLQENQKPDGVLLLLEPTPAFSSADSLMGPDEKPGWGFLLGYLKPHHRLFAQLILALLVALVLDLMFPFLTQSVVDAGIGNLDINLIYLLLFGQLAIALGGTALDIVQNWIQLHIGSRMSLALVSDFLHKLLRLPLNFFDTRTAGDIMQRVDDHSRINKFLNSSALNVVFAGVSFVVFATIMAIYNWQMLGIFVFFTAMAVGWMTLFLKRRRMLDMKRFDLERAERDKFVEMVGGIQEVKLQNMERMKRWEWEEINVRRFRLSMNSLALKHAQRIGTTLVGQMRNIVLTYIAAKAVIDGEMTLGMMLSTQFIIGQMASPVSRFMDFLHESQDARLSFERTSEVHRQKEEEHYRTPKLTHFPECRSIMLLNLGFKYPGAGSLPALSGLNMVIPEGRVTAVVGGSGSGKTTLLKLLLGLYTPTEGAIYLERAPLTVFDGQSWRARCGVVMQDGYVFSDTIARNITCDPAQPDPIRLQAAVQLACLDGLVSTLPLGLETKIGSDGRGLSGGQKQRLLLARAIYKNPEYLFLDEATSALDATTERDIMENLRRVFPGRTCVIIAHRLSTVKNADQIVVLDQGRMVEAGTHADLVAKGGYYYNLVRNQLELDGGRAHA
jgi:ATP-binding cassette subfamily B protein